MEIIYSDDTLQMKETVVALGNFDGVHIAHQALIKNAVNLARINSLKSVVYTFSKHPKISLGQELKLLTTNAEKELLFESIGVDVLVYQEPNADFLSISPEKFIADTVFGKLGAKQVVVGKDYRFGAKALGDVDLLKKLSDKFGVIAHIEELLVKENIIVSSSVIREFLLKGHLNKANELLGRHYSFTGDVIHGNHLGGKMGVPTANISVNEQKIIPRFGVYTCKVLIDGVEYNAVANIGLKPTIGAERPLIEAHILSTDGNFYGKNVTINLCEFLREEKKFLSIASLKRQIEEDVVNALEYFSNNFK